MEGMPDDTAVHVDMYSTAITLFVCACKRPCPSYWCLSVHSALIVSSLVVMLQHVPGPEILLL